MQLPIGTPEQTSPWGNVMSNALKQYQEGLNAQYGRREKEAGIFNKTISPLANIAISPLMTALAPTQQQQIAAYISQGLKQLSNGGQMGGYDAQQQQDGQQTQNPILGWISKLIGGGQVQSQQAQASLGQPQVQAQPQADEIDENGNPVQTKPGLIPQYGKGISEGAKTQATTPFNASPYKEGGLYQNPETGKVISAPTSGNVDINQKTIANVTAITPMIKSLAQDAVPFLQTGGSLGLATSQFAGEARKYGVPESITNLLGGTKLANAYANYESDRAKAIDKAMTVFNLPANAQSTGILEHIFTPGKGEDDKAFASRMTNELYILGNQAQNAKQVLGSGYNVGGNQQPKSAMILMEAPDGTQNFIAPSMLGQATKMGLKEVK